MTRRDRLVVTSVLLVASVAAFWMLALSPKREAAAKLAKDVATQQQQLATARQTADAGQLARRSYPSNYATVARLGEAVPTDDDVPSLVFQVQSAAQGAQVDFRSLKLSQGAGGATPSPPPSAPSGAAKTGSSAGAAGSTPSAPAVAPSGGGPAGSAASSAPASATSAATLPPGAAVGDAGFPTMPFNFAFEGNFFHLSEFFLRLERFIHATGRRVAVGGRLLTIDGISLSAGSEGFPHIKAAVSATAYLLPPDQGLTAGATPAAPGATAPGQPAAGGAGAAPGAPATAVPPTP